MPQEDTGTLRKEVWKPQNPLANSHYLIACPSGDGCRTTLGPCPSPAELLGNVADMLHGGLPALQEHIHQVAPHSVPDTYLPSLSSMHKGLCFAYSCRFLLSISSIHFCRRGCSLHMFFKLSYRVSKWHMVIWLNTFPKRTPRASPTSAWVYPRAILFCFKSLANCLVFIQSSHVLICLLFRVCLQLHSSRRNSTRLRGGPTELFSILASAWPSGWVVSRLPWGTSPTLA